MSRYLQLTLSYSFKINAIPAAFQVIAQVFVSFGVLPSVVRLAHRHWVLFLGLAHLAQAISRPQLCSLDMSLNNNHNKQTKKIKTEVDEKQEAIKS